MNNGELRVYGYRWVILAAFALIASMTQVLWITFAPITRAAADPAHANANNNLISLLYGQERYAEALALLDQVEAQKVQIQAGLKKAVLDAAKR